MSVAFISGGPIAERCREHELPTSSLGLQRLRHALFGAWHLGADFEDRRRIRKALRRAYDKASKAVHTGNLPSEAQLDLSPAQDLCHRGILKLLREGPPADWGGMILGAELS